MAAVEMRLAVGGNDLGPAIDGLHRVEDSAASGPLGKAPDDRRARLARQAGHRSGARPVGRLRQVLHRPGRELVAGEKHLRADQQVDAVVGRSLHRFAKARQVGGWLVWALIALPEG